MGQTLTHGVYLPDEGERNCYAGLAANWNILDGAVGTVASHTTQIAGKANDSDVVHKTGNESIAGNKTFTGTTRLSFQGYIYANVDVGTTPSSALGSTLYFSGKNDGQLGYARSIFYQTGATQTEIAVRNKFTNGALDPNGTYVTATINIGLTDAGDPYITTNGKFRTDLLPSATSAYGLGSSSYQWKTLNGINPGALSLPDYNNVLDVTSEIPIASLDGNTQININDYLPNKTGWLNIVIDDTTGNSIIATQGRPGGATVYNNSRTFHIGAQNNGFISVFFPILADMNKFVNIKASSLIQMRFYYCLGNV